MTNKDLIQTMNIVSTLAGNGETKIQKKLIKLFEKLKVYYDNYTELVESIQLENAQTDEKGTLLLDEKGGYRYSKEGKKKADKELKEAKRNKAKEISAKKLELEIKRLRNKKLVCEFFSQLEINGKKIKI